MVAAVEKSKFVYVLNRDNDARLTISSPLEVRWAGGGLGAVWAVSCCRRGTAVLQQLLPLSSLCGHSD